MGLVGLWVCGSVGLWVCAVSCERVTGGVQGTACSGSTGYCPPSGRASDVPQKPKPICKNNRVPSAPCARPAVSVVGEPVGLSHTPPPAAACHPPGDSPR